jgi:hypothetical protein
MATQRWAQTGLQVDEKQRLSVGYPAAVHPFIPPPLPPPVIISSETTELSQIITLDIVLHDLWVCLFDM